MLCMPCVCVCVLGVGVWLQTVFINGLFFALCGYFSLFEDSDYMTQVGHIEILLPWSLKGWEHKCVPSAWLQMTSS